MENRCPQCGAERPSGEEWEQKLCPACLMKLGLSGAIAAIPVPEPEPSASPQPEPKATPKSKPTETATERREPRWRWNWRWAGRFAGAAALLALLVIAAVHFAERPVRPAVVRFSIDTPGELGLQDFAVSPDGRALVYVAATGENESRLSIRPFDLLESREMLGSEGASMPFWSPDSRSIGFFAGGKLKTIRVDGGPPMTIADAPQPQGGTWSPDGMILFAPDLRGLQRVKSVGGQAEKVTSVDSPRGPLAYRWPQFLPDGRHFLFSALSRESAAIYVGSLDSGEIQLLIQGGSGGIYSDGRIFFVRDAVLMVQSFDAGRLEVTGEPQAIRYAESIGSRANRSPRYSVNGGVLAYRTGGASAVQILLWVDRNGKVTGTAGEPAEQEGFALSPDSNAVAVVRRASGGGAPDLWLLDLARGAATRATFDARGAASPLWAPDGSRVAFISRSASQAEIRAVAVNASSPPEVLLKLTENAVLDSWSPDSRFLLFTTTGSGRLSLWTVPFEGDHTPMPFLKGDFNYKQAQFSPDGRWVAYVSDESGRDEVYLRRFPSDEGRWLVSVGGGTRPAWRRDGRELLYLSPQRRLMSVAVESAGALRVATPRTLFLLPPGADAFEVAGDGQKVLIGVPPEEQQRSPINIVVNWAGER